MPWLSFFVHVTHLLCPDVSVGSMCVVQGVLVSLETLGIGEPGLNSDFHRQSLPILL